ncbi:hypothetical protein FRC03_007664 [Tulasnella sp. 419]|nr:hypothetical protein FRC03_007664 [Tulasnella sp. 419]
MGRNMNATGIAFAGGLSTNEPPYDLDRIEILRNQDPLSRLLRLQTTGNWHVDLASDHFALVDLPKLQNSPKVLLGAYSPYTLCYEKRRLTVASHSPSLGNTSVPSQLIY